jgi:hypothetical protein
VDHHGHPKLPSQLIHDPHSGIADEERFVSRIEFESTDALRGKEFPEMGQICRAVVLVANACDHPQAGIILHHLEYFIHRGTEFVHEVAGKYESIVDAVTFHLSAEQFVSALQRGRFAVFISVQMEMTVNDHGEVSEDGARNEPDSLKRHPIDGAGFRHHPARFASRAQPRAIAIRGTSSICP